MSEKRPTFKGKDLLRMFLQSIVKKENKFSDRRRIKDCRKRNVCVMKR